MSPRYGPRALMDPSLPAATTGFGAALAQSLLALVAVCVLAWWALRWGARRGVLPTRGRVAVLDRATLDPGRAVYVVRVGVRTLVLGGSEGSLTLLAELREGELPEPTSPAPEGFSERVARLRAKGP